METLYSESSADGPTGVLCGPGACEKMNNQKHNREHQKQVNQKTGDVKKYKTADPKKKQE